MNNMEFPRNSRPFGLNPNSARSSGGNNINNINMNDGQNDSSREFQHSNTMMGPGNRDPEFLRRLAASGNGAFSTGGMMGPGAPGMFGPNTANMMGNPSAGNPGMMTPQGMMGMGGVGAVGGGREGMPAERDDEFLLQLLLARRRRELQGGGDLPDGAAGSFSSDHPGNTNFNEIRKLRQNSGTGMGDHEQAMQLQQLQLQQLQQQQQLLQQQQQHMMFHGGAGFNFPGQNSFMMSEPGMVGNRRMDDFFMRAQQANNNNIRSTSNFQDHALLGFPSEQLQQQQQQRLESPSRILTLQQLAATGFDYQGRNRYHMNLTADHGGDMEKLDDFTASNQSGKSIKRQHKKKPADMPRRPLSAYNLFFSEERERILSQIDEKEGGSVESSLKNTNSKKIKDGDKAAALEDGKSSKKPLALLRPLLPSQKKRRPHRKTHGKIGFRTLAKMVGQRWKNLPEEQRGYYQDLAKEDMIRQKKAMEEYYMKQSEKVRQLDPASVEKDGKGSTTKAKEDTEAGDESKNLSPTEKKAVFPVL